MTVFVDHAFITCGVGAPEADVLLGRGFVEGSANVHPGQGTANRRFFFSNFMLELVWVTDPAEAASDAVRHTAIWERWSRRGEGVSRFGVVFGGAVPQCSSPPFRTRSYFPAYLPSGLSIEIAQGLTINEPALYWMPWLGADRPRPNEPVNHAMAVRNVSGLAIGLPNVEALSGAARRVSEAGLLEFFESTFAILEIRFPALQECLIDCRPALPVVFRGTA